MYISARDVLNWVCSVRPKELSPRSVTFLKILETIAGSGPYKFVWLSPL